MKQKSKQVFLFALLGLWGVFSLGCVAVAVGAAAAGGTVAYVRGDLQVTYDHNLERVHDAAVAGVNDLGFSLISDRGDRTGGEIIARTSEDQRIRITLKPLGDKVTETSIRIGTFGDQNLSMRIHEATRRHL